MHNQILARRREFNKRMLLGFPLVDSLYLDNPSPMVGGYLAWLAKQGAKPAPGGTRIDLRAKSHPVRSLREVLRHLNDEHRTGYWYRGQRKRHACLYRGEIPKLRAALPTSMPLEVDLDAVIPSMYRSFVAESPANWKAYELRPPLDYFAGPARAVISCDQFELRKLLLRTIDEALIYAMSLGLVGSARLTFGSHLRAAGTTVPQATLDFIAIAQHYEYGSAMTDVSKRTDVAAWFATRQWTSGQIAAAANGSPGVIYRFDAERISAILDGHLEGPGATAPAELAPVMMYGLADISSRFPGLKRPGAQAGGSILGMENLVLHLLMTMKGGIEAFPFDHQTVTGNETSLTRDDICPPDDPGIAIFKPEAPLSSSPLTEPEIMLFYSAMGDEERGSHICRLRARRVL